jgi:hypothetical protein
MRGRRPAIDDRNARQRLDEFWKGRAPHAVPRGRCGHIGVEALANRGDGGERRTDFEGDAREDQLLAAGRRDGLSDFWIVERVD